MRLVYRYGGGNGHWRVANWQGEGTTVVLAPDQTNAKTFAHCTVERVKGEKIPWVAQHYRLSSGGVAAGSVVVSAKWKIFVQVEVIGAIVVACSTDEVVIAEIRADLISYPDDDVRGVGDGDWVSEPVELKVEVGSIDPSIDLRVHALEHHSA